MILVVDKKRRLIILFIIVLFSPFYLLYILIKRNFGVRKKEKIIEDLANGNIKNIYINMADRFGDNLLSMPLVASLKKNFPNIRLVVLTNQAGKEIYKNNPHVDKIILIKNNWINQSSVDIIGFLKTFNKEYFKKILELRKEKIDLLLEIKGDFRNIIFFNIWLNARFIAGYALSGFGKLLDWEMEYEKNKHEIDVKLNIAKFLGASSVNRKMNFYLAEEDQEFARNFYKEKNIKEKTAVVIHVGGTWEPKLWMVDNFIEIGRRLKNKYGFKIILINKKSEEEKNKIFVAAMPETILAGNLTVGQSAAIMKNAVLFIGNDSGPMHLARSLEVPIVVIIGAELPSRVGPEEYGVVVRHDFTCQPCGQTICKKHPNCISGIEVDEVWQVIEKYLIF